MSIFQTYYNETLFNFEEVARWAVFFDKLKMKWIYKEKCFMLSDKTLYYPDFYLPESRTYFNVKIPYMIYEDLYQEKLFVRDFKKMLVIGYPDFSFHAACWWNDCELCRLYKPEKVKNCSGPNDRCHSYFTFNEDEKSDSAIARCNKCGKYYFLNGIGTFQCRNCGEHDGDHHMDFYAGTGRYSNGKNRDLYFDAIDAAKQISVYKCLGDAER